MSEKYTPNASGIFVGLITSVLAALATFPLTGIVSLSLDRTVGLAKTNMIISILIMSLLVSIVMFWSLLDNIEWAHGRLPCFGLIKVDYETGNRTIKESEYKYGTIIESSNMESSW